MAEPKFEADKQMFKIEINDVADKIKVHDNEADEIEIGIDNNTFELEDIIEIRDKVICKEKLKCQEINDATSAFGSNSNRSKETVIPKKKHRIKKGYTDNEEETHIEVIVKNVSHHDLECVEKYGDFSQKAPRKKLFYLNSIRLAKGEELKICDKEVVDTENGIDNETFELEDISNVVDKPDNMNMKHEIVNGHEIIYTTSEFGSNETVIPNDLHRNQKGNKDNEEESHIEVVVEKVAHHDLEYLQKYSDIEVKAPRKKLFYVDSKRLAKREKLKYLTINGNDKEKYIERKWRRTSSLRQVDDLEFNLDSTASPELKRSHYSLVSCSELTPGAVQLWLDLPEEVKYDSSLAVFRKFYEKEHGQVEDIPLKSKKTSSSRVGRLPLVNSAPHLNNNAALTGNGQNGNPKIDETEVKTIKTEERESKTAKAKHCIKITVLIGVWIFFTVIFMMYNEKNEIIRKSSVSPNQGKSFDIANNDNQLGLKLDLVGPFLTEHEELELNSTQKDSKRRIHVWLESLINPGLKNNELSNPSTILLQDNVDFVEGEKRTLILHLRPSSTLDKDESRVFKLWVNTTAASTVPFSIILTKNPLEISVGVMYACILLVALYGLIIFEIINRTLAAVVVATLSLAALALVGERPSLEEVVSWLDVETLLLLFSMMILVAIMAETGLFDFLAVFTFQVTKGSMWPLIILLCAITAVLSTFLDNVTTVLLMTPVTIKLCEVTDLNPIPVLMAMVLYSNIGGTATPVGDPPNVIIASNKDVTNSGINFANFTLHMTIGIIFVCFQTYFQLRYLIYKNPNKLRLSAPREIEDLRKQILVWRRAHDALPHISKDESLVKERLARKVDKLSLKLDVLKKERKSRAVPKDTFETTLKDLKLKYKIRDKILLIKALVAIGFVVAVFFLHALPEFHRVSLGWTALLGAILLLILADREELEPIMHRVEWSTLLFFAALFVLMEALSKLGLILYIGNLTESLIMSVNEGARLSVAMVLILWVSGVTSAFVDNIPLTTMMVRVVTSMGSNPTLNIPMAPLIWALSFGACLGGNGTLIGASANVVCAGVAEQHGYRFTFVEFFKVGFPIMIGHLIVASIYLLVCHSLFQWH